MPMPKDYPIIRKARIKDVRQIHALLMNGAANGLILPRPFNQLYSHLRDFFVLANPDSNDILGCCALSIAWEDLAEIRSLAVTAGEMGHGYGSRLVEACLSEAVVLGIYRVFTLTYRTSFFDRLGFKKVTKEELPQKVWADCINCPKFPECDEEAMLLELLT